VKPVILECEIYAELSRGESDFVAIAGYLHLMKHGHSDQCLTAFISIGIASSAILRKFIL
jgi:hypothetical protein